VPATQQTRLDPAARVEARRVAAAPARASWLRRRVGRSEAPAALLLLAPALLALVLLRLSPAISAVLDSFRQTSIGGQAEGWVGLENYRFLLSDPSFRDTVVATVVFNLVLNPAVVVLSLAFAVLLSERVQARGLWRSVVFAPAAMPVAVASIVWGIAFQPEGLINSLLGVAGVAPQPFLTSSGQALYALVVMILWVAVGYWMIFLIAGLQDVPRSYKEAALVDGATWWQRFRHVVLPLLRRPLAFVLVANTVGSFLVFAPVQILTSGGPDNSTNLVMFDIYRTAYTTGDLNLAQAEVVLLMLVMLVIVTVQFRLLSDRD
jgi:multiple sugar transport system permease protein